MMGRAYIRGLSSALRNWRFAVLVFVIGLLGALAFMACSWVWLASALDSSLATRTLLTSLDANVFIDLRRHHDDEFGLLVMVAAILAVGGGLLSIWVNAAVLAAVSGLHHSMSAAFRAGAASYFQHLKLWLGSMTTYVAVGVVAFIAGKALTRAAANSPDELTYYWIIGGCACAALAVAAVIATVHDHARIRCLATNETGGRAALWACGYVVRQRSALALTLLLVATTIAVAAIYQVGADAMPANSGIGLSLSLVWAQLFMAVRSTLRVWAFAAATELQGADVV